MDGSSRSPVKDPRTIARRQLELCKKAVEENLIMNLGTGCGKTHIAVLLMYELGHLIQKPSRSVCVFLTVEEKYLLVRSIEEECIQEEELWNLLEKKPNPICYDGFEPSGRMHIAQVQSDYGSKRAR